MWASRQDLYTGRNELRLYDMIVGLTTAHAIFDHITDFGSHPTSSQEHKAQKTQKQIKDRNNDNSTFNEGYTVSATLWAANLGDIYFPSTPAAQQHAQVGESHDFALLHLHPERNELAANSYQTSRGTKTIDTISTDLKARDVQLVCSSDDVKSGYLLDGDCIILDKAGYWETRKIQLYAPLGMFSCREMCESSLK
jgi:hypothetical protein